jgi:transcription antitermination factor NusG
METNTNLDTKLSAIDKALAAAKARKALRDGASGQVAAPAKAESPKKAAPSKKDETTAQAKEIARTLKKAELQKQREERKVAREAARAEKAKEREASAASKKPAHMKKIEKAAAALPALRPTVLALYEEITANHSGDQIAALALHLQHFNRVQQTKRALSLEIEAGDEVRIVSGPTKYIGKTGIVDRAQRIRCFVKVHGMSKPVYLFTSDVEPLNAATE